MSDEKEALEKIKKIGILDKITERIVSRKFLVWIVATVALFVGPLESQHFVAISLVFLGVQGLADIAATWRKAR